MSRNDYGPQSTLIVRNLADDSSSEELRNIFKEFGILKDVYIPLDYYTKRQRGFAYVQYEDPRDAKDALNELDGSMYLNQEMKIDIARGDRKTPIEMRHKERGGRCDRNDRRLDYDDRRKCRYDEEVRRYDNDDYYRSRDRSRSRSCNRRRSISRSDIKFNRRNYDNPRNYPRSPIKRDFRRAGNDPNFCRNPGPNYSEDRGQQYKWDRPVYCDSRSRPR